MPQFRLDLCDGREPICFNLKPDDIARLSDFLDECHGLQEVIEDMRVHATTIEDQLFTCRQQLRKLQERYDPELLLKDRS